MESGHILIFKNGMDDCEQTGNIHGNSSGFNDFDWYPWMNSSLQGSDLFLTSSKDLPLQLWRSGDRQCVCSWTAKDHLDQVANCLSVAFSPDGQNIISGGLNKLWIFNVNRPGDNATNIFQTVPKKRSKSGQSGIISSLNFRYDNTGVFAAGSFKGTIGIYDSRTSSSCGSVCALSLFDAHSHGVSQIKFLSDGWSVLSTGRRDNCLKKWDLRMIQNNSNHSYEPVMKYSLTERSKTNQRIYFDTSIDGSLYTGSQNRLLEFQIASGELLSIRNDFSDIVSSVSLSKGDSIAISSGSRKFKNATIDSDDSESEIEQEQSISCGSISFFRQNKNKQK